MMVADKMPNRPIRLIGLNRPIGPILSRVLFLIPVLWGGCGGVGGGGVGGGGYYF